MMPTRKPCNLCKNIFIDKKHAQNSRPFSSSMDTRLLQINLNDNFVHFTYILLLIYPFRHRSICLATLRSGTPQQYA
jgi:hypothetical protein